MHNYIKATWGTIFLLSEEKREKPIVAPPHFTVSHNPAQGSMFGQGGWITEPAQGQAPYISTQFCGTCIVQILVF